MEPTVARLKLDKMRTALASNAKTIQKTFGEATYQAMHSLCTCGGDDTETAEVTVVACAKSDNGGFIYRCKVVVGGIEKILDLFQALLDGVVHAVVTVAGGATRPQARSGHHGMARA
ncbi:hypothetical protein LDC_2201 [sediment metagenome]|uniref:Uncharacterized protein n=1 Tax=sediment metagenome TaxID=749907 RepID=D9PKY0_9ZZZZ